MIDRYALWVTVLKSWGFTLMGIFNIVLLLLAASFIVTRVAGAHAVAALLVPALGFMTLIFLLGEPIVNFIFDAEAPHPERDRRFIESLRRVSKKAGMWVRPRGWIVHIQGAPNAMAYGPGLPGLSAIGITRELVDMMTDDELDGIVAHELAHIRCRDTGILAVIGFILGMLDKLRNALATRQALLLQNPITVALGYALYLIGRVAFYVSRFSISQERELAADALGASYVGSVEPLISGLRKLHARSGGRHRTDGPIFEDLMVSHPGLEERIASLENIVKKERKH